MVSPTTQVDWAGLRAWPVHELANVATGLGAVERLARRGVDPDPELAGMFARLVHRTSAVAVILGALEDLEAGRDLPAEPVLLGPALASAGLPAPPPGAGPVLDVSPVLLRATLCALSLLLPDPASLTIDTTGEETVLAGPVTRFPPHPATRLLDLLAVEYLGGRAAWHFGDLRLTLPAVTAEEVLP